MSYVPTGPFTITKHLQYVEETTYGTTPTSTPSFTNAGSIIDLRETLEESVNRYRRLGSEDMYKQLETGELYSFEVTYQPTASTLIKYGTQAPGGTGTIEKSLSFVYSEDINDTENYVFFEGAKCDRTRIEVTPTSVLVTQNWICQNITTPSSSHGLTTPTFASADTGTPWVGADGGSNPFTHNSNNYDVDRFVIEVERNLDAIQVNGQTQISFLVPTNREITGEFDVLRKDTTLIADMKTLAQRTASYVLKSATSTVSFTNMVLESLKATHRASATSVPRDTFTYSATAISVS